MDELYVRASIQNHEEGFPKNRTQQQTMYQKTSTVKFCITFWTDKSINCDRPKVKRSIGQTVLVRHLP